MNRFLVATILIGIFSGGTAHACSNSALEQMRADVSAKASTCNSASASVDQLKAANKSALTSIDAQIRKAKKNKSKVKALKAKRDKLLKSYQKQLAAGSAGMNTACGAHITAQADLAAYTNSCSTPPFDPAIAFQGTHDPVRTAQLAELVHEDKRTYWSRLMVQKLMKFKLSNSCWNQLLTNPLGRHSTGFVVQSLDQLGQSFNLLPYPYGIESIEISNGYDRASMLPAVSDKVDQLSGYITTTLKADDFECGSDEWQRLHGYYGYAEYLLTAYSWKPTSGRVHITLVVTPTVDRLYGWWSGDLTQLVFVAPSKLAPSGWNAEMLDIITKGMSAQ